MKPPKKQTPGWSPANAHTKTCTPIFSEALPIDKTLVDIKAELTLRGLAVHDTATGGWLVARWDQSLHWPVVVDLKAFAARVGVRT